jgi:hypothetical protein
MSKCKQLCYWSDSYGECKKPDGVLCPMSNVGAERNGCSSCDGGFGDNTLVFAARGYKFCPYCGRKLEG